MPESPPTSSPTPPPTSSPQSAPKMAPSEAEVQSLRRYWRTNVTAMLILLSIWAFAGLICGVLIADWLNQFHIGGAPLGFWMAQQGSIIVFVFVILAYAIFMNRLDKKHHDELAAIRQNKKSS